MDNEREIVLNDFFKSLRITLNNCSIYFKEHPLFIKSIEKFHADTLAVLNFIDPLILGITPESLVIDEKYFEKESLYTELATFLHRRKIKSIEIKKSITVSDIGAFVTSLSMPVSDIFKEGGLSYIFEKLGVSSITVEELDYSLLLRAEGEEQKNVWAYLLKKAVKEQNQVQINNIVDNFDAALEKIKISDFSENENLRGSISNFLNFLKKQEKRNFDKCAKSLIRAISNSKAYTGKDKIKQLAFLADSLTPDEISNILCEEVTSEDAFNVKSIELFSSLLDRHQNEEVASALVKRIKKESGYNNATVKRTKELLASLEETSVKMIYHHALSSLLADMGLAGSLSFDAEQIKINYRIMLLNLFAEERVTSGLFQIADNIYPELDRTFNEADISFVRDFFSLIMKKIDSGSGLKKVLEEIKSKADRKLEEALLLKKIDFEIAGNFISKTTFDRNFYLTKIFIEKDVSYNIFRLYFNFFPRDTAEFYRELRLKSSDINFIKNIIETLKDRDDKIVCAILENVFRGASRFLRMEILKIMQKFSSCDENFILAIMAEGELSLKRQAMAIVIKNSSLRQKTAVVLLSIPNRFGIKNKIINENINMIGEFKLSEARGDLENISKLKAFWKRSLKDSAIKALRKLQ